MPRATSASRWSTARSPTASSRLSVEESFVSDRVTWTADPQPLIDGSATGVALVLEEPLSLWGGLDPQTGTIIDVRHPQHGANVAGRALAMPVGRGSSSSSNVLAEAIRAGAGPSLVCLVEPDEIIVLGALVAELLDGTTVPVVVLEQADYDRLNSGDTVSVGPGGRLEVVPG